MSSINTSFNSNFNFNISNKKSGNVNSINTTVSSDSDNLVRYKSKAETETLDMEDTEVEQVESLTKEEYSARIKEYKKYTKECIKELEKSLDEIDKEIAALEYWDSGVDPKTWMLKYKGKYDYAELRKIARSYDPKEAKKKLEELESARANINSTIYKYEQTIKSIEYDNLNYLDEFKNFEKTFSNDKTEMNKIDISRLYTKVYEGNLESYCKTNNIDINKINELEYVRLLKEQSDSKLNNYYNSYYKETPLGMLLEINDPDMMKKYDYYFETYGRDRANEYLEDIKDTLHREAGKIRADEFLATLEKDGNGNYNNKEIVNYLLTCIEGGGNGFLSFFEGIANWFESDHVYSASEYEAMYIMEKLKENESFFNFLDNTFELSQSMGNMVPSILLGYATGNPVLGTTMMGISSGGKAYHGAMVEGHDRFESIAYGILSGSSEAALQYFIGKIPGVSGDVDVKSLKTFFQAGWGEISEEAIQELFDSALLSTAILGEETEFLELCKNVAKSGLYGGIMGGAFNLPALVSSSINTNVDTNTSSSQTNDTSLPSFLNFFAKKKKSSIDNNVSNIDSEVNNTTESTKLNNDELLNLNRDLTSSEKTQIWIEYNNIIDKWGDDFDYYKNLVLNHGAGDMQKQDMMFNDLKRLKLIEGKLGIKGDISVANATEDYKVSNNKTNNEVNEGPIPIINENKIDTNSPQYKEAMREIYSKPSPTGKQVLDSSNNPFNQTSPKIKLDDLKYSKSSLSQYALEYLKSNFRRFTYVNTNMVEGLNTSIKENGLYHFTDKADIIFESGYVKPSGYFDSYGNKKSFFFNGIPSVGQFAHNLDGLPLTAMAVKVNPTDDVISSNKLRVRNIDDGAITFDGNYYLTNQNATREYFCIFKEGDELVYKKVSKEFYDNYANTAEGKAMAEFLADKKNIESIVTDYLGSISLKNSSRNNSVISGLKKHIDSMFSPQLGIIDSNASWFLNNFGKKSKFSNNTDVSNVTTGISGADIMRSVDLTQMINDDLNKFNSLWGKASFRLKSVFLEADKGHAISVLVEDMEMYREISAVRNKIKRDALELKNLYDKFGSSITRKIDIDATIASLSYVSTSSFVEDDIIKIINKHNAKYPDQKDALARLQAFSDPKNKQYGDYSLISSNDGARNILRMYTPEQVAAVLSDLEIKNLLANNSFNRASSNSEMYNFFENTGVIGNSQYGVDQGVIKNLCTYEFNGHQYSYKQARDIVNNAYEKGLAIPKFTKTATQEYFDLKNKLIKKGFSKSDASVILSSIDDRGACSYASVCNELFYYFRNNSDLFEKLMGYSMYKVKNGKKVLNSTELLLDLWLHANDVKNGGKFIVNNKLNTNYLSTKVDVFGRQMLDTSKQVYMSGGQWGGKNYQVISSFLKSKSSSLKYDTSVFINNYYDKIKYTEQEFNAIVSNLEKEINNGKSISMGIYYNPKNNDKNIRMLSYNTNLYRNMETASWNEGFGHSVAVTGITSNGFVVSSWGEKYMIPFDDLRDGGKFIISSSGIKINN